MKGYRYLSHTADVEFLAHGSTLEMAFKNALLALFDTVSYTERISEDKSKSRTFLLHERVKTLDKLLWYALQDALSIMDMKDMFAYRVSGLKIRESKGHYTLVAKVHAKKRRIEDSKLDAKGVSMYDLKVGREKGRFFARAVVDV